jgi:hypothetical protein
MRVESVRDHEEKVFVMKILGEILEVGKIFRCKICLQIFWNIFIHIIFTQLHLKSINFNNFLFKPQKVLKIPSNFFFSKLKKFVPRYLYKVHIIFRPRYLIFLPLMSSFHSASIFFYKNVIKLLMNISH